MMDGISATEAAENLRVMFANPPGTCTVAEFEVNPQRYLDQWLGSLALIYMAAKSP